MARSFSISVEPQFCVFIALMVMLIPLPWVVGWILAAAVHEASHCLALRICGKRIWFVSVGFSGAKIGAGELSNGQTVFCSLAGPVGASLLLAWSEHYPQLAVCALVQSAYNLLPVGSLDGGRAMYGISHLMLPDRVADRVCNIISMGTCACIVTFGVIASFVWNMGCLPVVFSSAFVLRMIKIPCKVRRQGVQ